MIRRPLSLLMSMVLAVSLLSGCRSSPDSGNAAGPDGSLKENPPGMASGGAETTAAPADFKQSPYLEGKGLPPVKERLPKEPKLTNELPKDALSYEIGT